MLRLRAARAQLVMRPPSAIKQSSVVVTVVEVGHVRVSMDQFAVAMWMHVPIDFVRMCVVVMAVVVFVFVVVPNRHVAMLVKMRRVEDGAYAQQREAEGEELGGGDRLTQHQPGDDRANERSDGEDELRSGRAEVAGTGHPQSDGKTVAEGADHESGPNLAE